MADVLYNDTDRGACAWLRELMGAGLISKGDVDERSIADLVPAELVRYRRVHLFAGIGGWDHALKLAGWPESEPVWTGSCPCQPFSSAGKGLAEKDHRHLWPHMRRLVAECRPPAVIGEQVSSKRGREWFAGVHADLEALGYRVAAADLCVAGEGAPHIRQRLFWIAYRLDERRTVSSEPGGLRQPEAVVVEETREGVCLPQQPEGQYLHAPPDPRVEEGGGNCGPHQPEQARQSAGEPASGNPLREQPQPATGDGWCNQAQGPEPLDRLPVDRQEVSVAGLVRDQGAGNRGEGGSPAGGGPDHSADLERLAYAGRPPQGIDPGRGRPAGAGGAHEQLEGRQETVQPAGRRHVGHPANMQGAGRLEGDADGGGRGGVRGGVERGGGPADHGAARGVGQPVGQGPQGRGAGEGEDGGRGGVRRADGPVGTAGPTGGLADAPGVGQQEHIGGAGQGEEPHAEDPGGPGRLDDAVRDGRGAGAEPVQPGGDPPGGSAPFWAAFDLVHCRDGKARRVEPGTFPLADGVPGRVGLLRGYGNAICPQAAATFIRACREAQQVLGGDA